MSSDPAWERIARASLENLRVGGVELGRGLSGDELSQVEEHLGCAVPPDLRVLLGLALPVGDRFPPWRDLDSPLLERQLARPVDGLVFDVEHNDFWHPDWPTRPAQMDDAIADARRHLTAAPVLIPIYAHRYLPSEPCASGNPVLSVMQADIIYYGQDLVEYTANDHRHHRWQVTEPVVRPPFWAYFTEAD